MRVTVTVVLACLLAEAYGKAAQVGYQHPLQDVQQTGQTQVEGVQQTGQTQVVTSEEEHDDDDLSKDPDWVPTDHDYAVYEADRLEDYHEGSEEYDDDDDYDDGYEYDLEDENELWLSDDDPDWVPEEDEQEEASDYDTLLLQIAQLIQANAKLHPELVHDSEKGLSLNDLVDNIRSINMSELEARQVLDFLILSGKQYQEANEISQEDQESQEDQTLPGHLKGGQGHLKRSLVMTKRHVKTQYEVQQQGQYGYRPDQVTTQNQQQGQGEVDASQLSQGVEPLVPFGGHQHEDLGDGVEPEQGSSHGKDEDDEPSLLDFLHYGWGYARDVAETVGDKAQEAASEVIDKVQDAAQTAGEGVATLYQSVRGDLRRFKAALLSTFAKFGTVVQEGLGYCIDRLTHSYHQVQGMQVLEKLEKKLSEGNEHVVKFFNKIGQKVSKWKEQQLAENVDEGLVQGQQQAQAGHQTEGQNQDIEQVIPDLFQDDEVLIELNKLVELGELTQDDIQVITQQDQQQGQQQGYQQGQQQGYQQEQQQAQQQQNQEQQQAQQNQEQQQAQQQQNQEQQQAQQQQNQEQQQAQQQQNQEQQQTQQQQNQEQHHGYY